MKYLGTKTNTKYLGTKTDMKHLDTKNDIPVNLSYENSPTTNQFELINPNDQTRY